MQCDLFVFMGLIASGKSTLAKAWSTKYSLPYFNSDVVRKELSGFSASSRQADSFHRGIYTPEMSRKTYDALLDKAQQVLTSGKSVVLDASYSSQAERDIVCRFASKSTSRFFFILCQCSDEETHRRLEKRRRNPVAVSDATWDIYQKQKQHFEYPAELPSGSFFVLDTKAPVDQLILHLQEMIPNP